MAWTKAVTKLSPQHNIKRGDGRKYLCYKMTVVSDTSASGDITLSTELNTTYGAKESERLMREFYGSALYFIQFVAGTSTEEPTLTVDDEHGLLLFSEAITDGEINQAWAGNKDTAYAPMLDAIIACGALAAAATKTATFYFWFIK